MKVTAAALLIAFSIPGASHGPALPLLSYLDVGGQRLAFEADTGFEGRERVAVAPTTFPEAGRALGAARLRTRGQAGDLLRWVCYRIGSGPGLSLILEGDEMSGDQLGGFEFVPAGTRASLEGSCVPSTAAPTAVRTNRGVRLGLSRSEVDELVGFRGRDSADVVVYARTVARTTRDPAGNPTRYDQASTIWVMFRRNRVAGFGGWRVDAS